MGRMSFSVLCIGILGFGILYVPMAVMVAFSFNAGKLVSVWAGFSTKWYTSLITNEQLLNAYLISLLNKYLTDDEFRNDLETHEELTVSGSNF